MDESLKQQKMLDLNHHLRKVIMDLEPRPGTARSDWGDWSFPDPSKKGSFNSLNYLNLQAGSSKMARMDMMYPTNSELTTVDVDLTKLGVGEELAFQDPSTSNSGSNPEQLILSQAPRRVAVDIKECWTPETTERQHQPRSSNYPQSAREPKPKNNVKSAIARVLATKAPHSTLSMLTWPQKRLDTAASWTSAQSDAQSILSSNTNSYHNLNPHPNNSYTTLTSVKSCFPTRRSIITFLVGFLLGALVIVFSGLAMDLADEDETILCPGAAELVSQKIPDIHNVGNSTRRYNPTETSNYVTGTENLMQTTLTMGKPKEYNNQKPQPNQSRTTQSAHSNHPYPTTQTNQHKTPQLVKRYTTQTPNSDQYHITQSSNFNKHLTHYTTQKSQMDQYDTTQMGTESDHDYTTQMPQNQYQRAQTTHVEQRYTTEAQSQLNQDQDQTTQTPQIGHPYTTEEQSQFYQDETTQMLQSDQHRTTEVESQSDQDLTTQIPQIDQSYITQSPKFDEDYTTQSQFDQYYPTQMHMGQPHTTPEHKLDQNDTNTQSQFDQHHHTPQMPDSDQPQTTMPPQLDQDATIIQKTQTDQHDTTQNTQSDHSYGTQGPNWNEDYTSQTNFKSTLLPMPTIPAESQLYQTDETPRPSDGDWQDKKISTTSDPIRSDLPSSTAISPTEPQDNSENLNLDSTNFPTPTGNPAATTAGSAPTIPSDVIVPESTQSSDENKLQPTEAGSTESTSPSELLPEPQNHRNQSGGKKSPRNVPSTEDSVTDMDIQSSTISSEMESTEKTDADQGSGGEMIVRRKKKKKGWFERLVQAIKEYVGKISGSKGRR